MCSSSWETFICWVACEFPLVSIKFYQIKLHNLFVNIFCIKLNKKNVKKVTCNKSS